ncbi:MAG: DUF5696 domain-containing protein [Candidatus Limiplasma sp.]|nr:DUF5696 domain-containing protein [Candidatus Limiplasma sp.]
MNKGINRGWALALVCALALGLCPPPGRAQSPAHPAGKDAAGLAGHFQLVVENEALALYTDPALGEIALADKRTGTLWFSNPPLAQEDALASGMPRWQMLSQLYVRYVDGKNNTFFAASRFSCVEQNAMTSRLEDGSVTYIMDFVRDSFRIPVRYSLGEDYFKAEVLLDEIQEYGENTISQITLLPFFGAGGEGEEGYLFVPDGSGALIDFHNGKQGAESFSLNVYGDEAAFGRELMDISRQKCLLPVFGMQKGASTLLGVIHGGAAKAAVTANVSGKYTGYNTVSSTYNHRLLGSVKLPTKNFQNRSVQVLERASGHQENYEVRYYPIPQGDGYVGMARRYRAYLMEEAGLQPREDAGTPSLYLDLTGAVNLKKPVLGVPAQVPVALTPFEEAAALIGSLKEAGVENLSVRYLGWNGGGIYGKLPAGGGAEAALGGGKALKELLSAARDAGVRIWLGADLMNVYRTGNGVSRFFDTAQNINRTVALQYRYLPNTFLQDTQTQPWFLLAPRLLRQKHGEYARRVEEAAGAKSGVGIALETTGSFCYSDFSGNPSSRSQSAAYSLESLRDLREAGYPLLLKAAYAYALPQADALTHVPDGSSGFDVTDRSVPFYQIALHGLVDMASLPINLCAQPRLRLLKCIELGMSPTYSLATGDASQIKNTRADMLYSIEAQVWREAAAQAAQEVARALEDARGQLIVDHALLAPGVTKTVYANGYTVWVNATQQEASAEGRTIPALGWTAAQAPAKDGAAGEGME